VPPVMICVPQFMSGCDLSRSRVSKVEKNLVAAAIGQHAGTVDVFFVARLNVQRLASGRHLRLGNPGR
jgi:hypothetical protein